MSPLPAIEPTVTPDWWPRISSKPCTAAPEFPTEIPTAAVPPVDAPLKRMIPPLLPKNPDSAKRVALPAVDESLKMILPLIPPGSPRARIVASLAVDVLLKLIWTASAQKD